MLTFLLIILLICLVIYFYWQKKLTFSPDSSSLAGSDAQLIAFMQTKLNSANLEELRTKLNDKTLDELLEENEDYETEIDNLTRAKNSLEADLLAQSNGFQNRLREKDREIKKVKEDLTNEQKRLQKSQENLVSEKAQHKGSLERISLLTQQISQLEQEKASLAEQLKKMPGEFPEEAPKESSPELEKFIK